MSEVTPGVHEVEVANGRRGFMATTERVWKSTPVRLERPERSAGCGRRRCPVDFGAQSTWAGRPSTPRPPAELGQWAYWPMDSPSRH
jgi:hypothetical protein